MYNYSVRGTVNALGFLINSLGGLAGFIAAIFLDFRMQAFSALSVPLLFAFVFYFVPESPHYLYGKNQMEVPVLTVIYYRIISLVFRLHFRWAIMQWNFTKVRTHHQNLKK